MNKLNPKQKDALDLVYGATLGEELDKALADFEGTLPKSPIEKRAQIAEVLIADLNGNRPTKKKQRSIMLLTVIDTPNAAAAITKYAYSSTEELDDRVQSWALVSLAKMTGNGDLCRLLLSVKDDQNTKTRIRALSLRLLMQFQDVDREDCFKQLLEMGDGRNADNKWAVMRALRNDYDVDPLPAELEKKFIIGLVAPTLNDEFEWTDVQIQAALVLGDSRYNLEEAMLQLSLAFKSSTSGVVRRTCIESIHEVAQRMDKKQRDASPFNDVMLTALDDENRDVRSRAYASLRKILGPQAAANLIIDQLLQQEVATTGQLEALRFLDDNIGRSSKALREHLFDPDPEKIRRANEALTNLGGDQAFRILFSQSEKTINHYTNILNEADEKILGLYNSLMFQARWAFWFSMGMHGTIFLLGVLFLNESLAMTLNNGFDDFWGLFGLAGGVVAIYLGLFYKNPIKNISTSVTRLVKINVTFLGYMRQINQIDATFKHLFLTPAGFDTKTMEKSVELIQDVVERSLEKIQEYLVVKDVPASSSVKERAVQGVNTAVQTKS